MRDKPIKHLGQNFLTSKKIIEDIIRAADLSPDDVVLEAGPGKGILTEAILEKIPRGKLIAVEKDKRLVEYLNKKFAAVYSNLEIIYGDILKFDSGKLKANEVKSYKIVANIPYYITSRFLRNFLESDYQPSRMVLMLQKEVAERIACPNGCKESILSISVKAYGEPKIIKKVPAEFFSPKPKVDSAILLINNISKDFFTKNKLDEKNFFELARAGFAHKRKFLIKNLSDCSKLGFQQQQQWRNVFDNCGISEKARAEDLKLEDWKCFAKGLHFFEHLV